MKALKQVQVERPAYASGAPDWWGEVIKRTALGAGADPTRECNNLIEPTKPPGLRDASRTRSWPPPHHSADASDTYSFVHLRGFDHLRLDLALSSRRG